MKCCANCFGDQGLQNDISFVSSEDGTCGYCASENVPLVEPAELLLKFESLLDTYDLDENGKPLAYWLKKDWFLFSHPRMDDARSQVLLGDIFNDGEIARKPLIPSEKYDPNRLGRWDDFRQELIHQNRFFPQSQVNLDELSPLLPLLAINADDMPVDWYRARMQSEGAIFDADKMKAPPPHMASHGRANPAGIPYLYLGSKIVTSISEIRPHTGEIACVAEFSIQDDLELIDLRHPRQTVSPFSGGGAENVGQMRFDLEFLERLGNELTRPVRRQATAFDYTPSQYLCEFIKKCGYDGVVYRSSVSDGINLALFYPDKATIGEIHQHTVDQVSVKVTNFE